MDSSHEGSNDNDNQSVPEQNLQGMSSQLNICSEISIIPSKTTMVWNGYSCYTSDEDTENCRKIGKFLETGNIPERNEPAISVTENKDKINSIIVIRENKAKENVNLFTIFTFLNADIKFGSAGVLFSKNSDYRLHNDSDDEIGTDGLLPSIITEDRGRLKPTYREKFSIHGLSGYYKLANGEYTLTTYFKNSHPTYTNKNNTWKIWYNNEKLKWTLTSTASNSYLDSTNPPLYGDTQTPHACIWTENNQNGFSSHRVLAFNITDLEGNYAGHNDTFRVNDGTFIFNHPTYVGCNDRYLIRWDDNDERWKLALYEVPKNFASKRSLELYNLSRDITSGKWVTDADANQRGNGPNSAPDPTPTPTQTPTPTPTKTPTPTPTIPDTSVVQVAAGPNYALILRESGEVEVTGDNAFGNLGTGDNLTVDDVRTAKVKNIMEVATGSGHSLFLDKIGNLFACGKNNFGQLGDGTTSNKNIPTKIADNVISVSCLGSSSFYVKTDGKIYGFGYNQGGELGTGTFKNEIQPTELKTGFTVPSMIARYDASETKADTSELVMRPSEKSYMVNSRSTANALKDNIQKGETGKVEIVYLEDIIAKPEDFKAVIDANPSIETYGILVRDPSKLSPRGSTEVYYASYRAYYLQTNKRSNELIHRYNGRDPFAQYNFYIKSWKGSRPYLIKSSSASSKEIFNSVNLSYTPIRSDAIKVDSERGNVFDFDNREKYFDMGDIFDDVFTTGTFSVSFWSYLRSTKATENSKRTGMFVSKWNSSTRPWSQNSFIIYASGAFVSAKNNRVSNLLGRGNDTYDMPLNKWTHFTYSLDKGKLTAFVNGEQVPVSNANVVHEFTKDTRYKLCLGILEHNKAYGLNGKMDDFRLFNRPLNATEVNVIMKNVDSNTQSIDNFELPKIRKVRSGDFHTFLITEEDDLWGFGKNDKGQLGEGSNDDVTLPKKVTDIKVNKVAPGTFHSVILDTEGEIHTTGDNTFGQIGLVTSPGVNKFKAMNKPKTRDIAVGSQHSLLLDSKGNIMVAGKNKSGQLGIGSFESRNIFSRASLDNINKIFAGTDTTYYVIKDELVFASGNNNSYQMADGTKFNRPVPVQVGIKIPPTPTPTFTPTPTPTYNEWDTSKQCEITLQYLYRSEPVSYKTGQITFSMNVSRESQRVTQRLLQTSFHEGKYAEVKNVTASTKQVSNVLIQVVSSTLVEEDDLYYLECELELPALNVECEFKGDFDVRGTPEIVQKIVPSDAPRDNAKFGDAVAMYEDHAVVGTPNLSTTLGSKLVNTYTGGAYFLRYKLAKEMVYEVTEQSYDVLSIGASKFKDTIRADYPNEIEFVYLEDLINDNGIIDNISPALMNNVSFLIREPQKLSTIGGTANEYFYDQRSNLKRPYYLQFGKKGLTHTYTGKHPFSKYNLYIKSWYGAKKYIIKNIIETTKPLEGGEVITPEDTLLHIQSNNTNGSSSFKDISVHSRTVTNVGQLKHVSSQKNLGATSSIGFDGTSYLTLPDSELYNLGADDFTIEGWFNYTSLQTRNYNHTTTLINHHTTGGDHLTSFSISIQKNRSITAYLFHSKGKKTALTTGVNTISPNTWFHYAFVRTNGKLYLYLNGKQKDVQTIGNISANNCPYKIKIGRILVRDRDDRYYPKSFIGFMQDIRITRKALYKSDFDVQTKLHNPFSFKLSDGWNHIQQITNPDKHNSAYFGGSVDINGDTAVIGAFNGNQTIGRVTKSQAGVVYVYKYTNRWDLFQTLVTDEVTNSANFGQSVSIDGDIIVVGAYTHTSAHTGACWVFKRKDKDSKFEQIQRLEPTSTSKNQNYFGRSVCISGKDLVIGAWGDPTVATKSGAVYFYRLAADGKFDLLTKDYHPGKQTNAYFGFSVSVHKNTALVGCHGEASHGTNSGAVYIYKRFGTEWRHFDTIYPNQERNANTQFGYQVKVYNNRLLVSAYRDDNEKDDGGSVYMYTLAGEKLDQIRRLFPDRLDANDLFGSSIDMSEDFALVGAYGDDDKGDNVGAVYSVKIPKTIANIEKEPTPTPTPSPTPTPTPTPTLDDNECMITLYYEIYLKDGEQSARLVAENHFVKKINKSDKIQSFTEKLITLDKPKLIEGDPNLHFIRNFKASPGEVLREEVKRNGVDISFHSKVIEDPECQSKNKDCEITYTYVIPPILSNCQIGDLPPTPTPTVKAMEVKQDISLLKMENIDFTQTGLYNQRKRIATITGDFDKAINPEKNDYLKLNANTNYYDFVYDKNIKTSNYPQLYEPGGRGGFVYQFVIALKQPINIPKGSKININFVPDGMSFGSAGGSRNTSTNRVSMQYSTKSSLNSIRKRTHTWRNCVCCPFYAFQMDGNLGSEVTTQDFNNVRFLLFEGLLGGCNGKPTLRTRIQSCSITTKKQPEPVISASEIENAKSEYTLTEGTYDPLSTGTSTFISALATDDKLSKITPVYLEDLIEDEAVIQSLGAAYFNNAGILIREPKKLAKDLGGHNNTYYYDTSINRPFYLQLNTNGYKHTYNGKHPFQKYNLYVKSWPGKRKYLITKTSDSLANVPDISVQYSSTAPAVYSPEGFKNSKPYWRGTFKSDNAFIWYENDKWNWNTAFSGKERELCSGNKPQGEYPWEVSPFVHNPTPAGWKNEGITVIVNESAPKNVNIQDENLVIRWHANSMSLPNTAVSGNKYVGLVHNTKNVFFDKSPHVKNIKVSKSGEREKYIRGVELQQNISPTEGGPPYLYVDTKIDPKVNDFSVSFFYKPLEENLVKNFDTTNIMKNAQGVFAFNQKQSDFFRMFTLKNTQDKQGSLLRYFDYPVASSGTSLYIDGGAYKKPQQLVSRLDVNSTYFVVLKYKKPTEQSSVEVVQEGTDYVQTKSNYDLTKITTSTFLDTIKKDYDGAKSTEFVYIEDLIENPTIIEKLTPTGLNNIGILVKNPRKLSTIGGTATEFMYNQSSRLKRPYYLQIGTGGLIHTYGGKNPFKSHNLYIKSWYGARKYLVKQSTQILKNSYARTPKTYNFGVNPSMVEKTALGDNTSKGYNSKMLTLEHLIANKHLIKELGVDFFDYIGIKIELPSKLSSYNTRYNNYAYGTRIWYLQKTRKGAIWTYNGKHPFAEFDLYIKSWRGSRSIVVLKEPTEIQKTDTGEFSIQLHELTGNNVVKIENKIDNHDFHIDWTRVSNLSVGGGSNCVIADFRVYNKLIDDLDVNKIIDMKNSDFNSSGPTFP